MQPARINEKKVLPSHAKAGQASIPKNKFFSLANSELFHSE